MRVEFCSGKRARGSLSTIHYIRFPSSPRNASHYQYHSATFRSHWRAVSEREPSWPQIRVHQLTRSHQSSEDFGFKNLFRLKNLLNTYKWNDDELWVVQKRVFLIGDVFFLLAQDSSSMLLQAEEADLGSRKGYAKKFASLFRIDFLKISTRFSSFRYNMIERLQLAFHMREIDIWCTGEAFSVDLFEISRDIQNQEGVNTLFAMKQLHVSPTVVIHGFRRLMSQPIRNERL